MKRWILAVLMGLFAIRGFTQDSEKPVIVITPVDLFDVDEKSGELLFRRMQSEFVNTNKFKVVDRGSFDKLRNELEFQGSDWSNPDKIAEMKKAFNARFIVTSTVESYEGVLYVTINIIDVNTTQIISSENSNVKNIQELMNGQLKMLITKVSSKVQVDISDSSYIIGGFGPGGGIVFYYSQEGFKVYNSDGTSSVFHYLECSQEVLGVCSWCPDTSGSGYCDIVTRTVLGYGKINTERILSSKHKGESLSISNCAAMLCNSYYTTNTKKGDWWLPSKDELDLMWQNFNKAGILDDGVYWSSSEREDYNYQAWMQSFYYAVQEDEYKTSKYSVRAIRAFNN